MKIAVLSDIHSAADHFRDAIAAAREEGFDRLVILGDLFTYGPDPLETLEIANEAAARADTIFIKGNHDVLYCGGDEAKSYSERMPVWIRESVEWTTAQLKDVAALNGFAWQEEWEQDRVLFSHANPFGPGDWTYLQDEESLRTAWRAVNARSLDWGVFGHVHRYRVFASDEGPGGAATVGSIGQPRDRVERFGQWAMVTTTPRFSVEQRPIARNWAATIDRIQRSSLSDTTKERLCQFYQ